jgi:hypothetical protein
VSYSFAFTADATPTALDTEGLRERDVVSTVIVLSVLYTLCTGSPY